MSESIKQRLQEIQKRIRAAEVQHARLENSVKLLAVTKTQSIEKIREVIQAGQVCFGENYVTEALPKIHALTQYDLEWHFIGAVQSNKTKEIAENFSWVHSVTRTKIAMRLNEQRSAHLPPLNVCIQVNIDEDPAKQGVGINQLLPLAEFINTLPRLRLRGLMVIPQQKGHTDPRDPFRALRSAKEYLQNQGITLDTLSMGMTEDFEAAIAEGATIVRVGTAIFGERGKI